MSPPQSLDATLKQLNFQDLSSTFNHFADDKARWENELARLISIKPSRGYEVPDLNRSAPSALHPSTPTALPDTNPQTATTSAPVQHIAWSTAAPEITPAASSSAISQLNLESKPFSPGPPTTPHYPASIPKSPNRAWLNMQCPIAFSPCSPRHTWPWPGWVCDAFERGDVLYYTIGPDAKPHINIKEQRKDLMWYFHNVRMHGVDVNWGGGGGRCGKEDVDTETEKLEARELSAKAEMEGTQSVEASSKIEQRGDGQQDCEKSGLEKEWRRRVMVAANSYRAKAMAQLKEQARPNKGVTQSGDEETGLQRKRLEHVEVMMPAEKKVRVEWDAQHKESREEGVEEWEVLDGAFGEEEWVDVSNERTAGDRWTMVRRTVRSGGQGEDDGA